MNRKVIQNLPPSVVLKGKKKLAVNTPIQTSVQRDKKTGVPMKSMYQSAWISPGSSLTRSFVKQADKTSISQGTSNLVKLHKRTFTGVPNGVHPNSK